MTDRIATLTVFLDEPMREEDAQVVIDAIKMMRRVSRVTKGEPVDMNVHMWQSQYGYDLYREVESVLAKKLLGIDRSKTV
jgi:hypothetical protein